MSPAKLSALIVTVLLVCVPGAAAKSGLTVAIAAPRSGQRISGDVTWRGKVGGADPRRVVFAVDGKVSWSQRHAPFLYGGAAGALQTGDLTDGPHVLSATAYGPQGTRRTTKITVFVSNSPGRTSATGPVTSGSSQPGTGSAPTAAAKVETVAAGPLPEPLAETQPLPLPTDPSPPAPLPEIASSDRRPIYWGASIGSQLTGTQAPWDMGAVTKFEELARKPVSMIQFFQPFENCATAPCQFYAFPKQPLENVRLHGAVPVLSWASESIPALVAEPDFQLADVIAGNYDAQIRAFATAAKQWGHPFLLRFDWEMNGAWFPWSESANGNGPGEYVAAWRHVHDIFTAVGATNATWVWCPNIDPSHSLQGLGSLYPGDEYVDWTGLDGYNWGSNPIKPGGWQSFDQIYSTTYRELTEVVAPTKPVLVGEIGSSEYGGSKAAWIANALERIPAAYPQIRAVIWFDKRDGGFDWPIETSSAAATAFADGVAGPLYLGNSFASLPGPRVVPSD